MWALSFSVEYLVSLRHLVADDYLYNYWKKAFMPLPPGGTRIWLGRTYYSLLLTTLNRTDQILAVLIPVLILIGGLSLLYQEWQFAIIISSPFFIALFASVVQKYPLKDRFMLFLAPLVLFLIAEGLGCIYTLIAKLHKGIASIIYIIPVLVLFLLPASVTWENFLVPSVRTNVKPVLQYVSEHGQKDEIIYIFHTSDSTFAYYAPFYGLEDENVIFGKDSFVKQEALDGFYNDVQTLKGKDRVWFIFSGIVDCGGCEGDMQSFYVNYLNKQGTMLDSVHSVDANAYLYDLNP
jgi:hypothetical protein